MTNQDLETLKAAFLARGGAVRAVEPGLAYGVDAQADKAKREAERDRIEAQRSLAECERHAERYTENVREAYHTGGRRAAIEAMQGERSHDHTHYD